MERVLVISPHPDDVDFACNGTMALWSKEKEIYYLICTSGEKGKSGNLPLDKIKQIREKEQLEAAKIIGVKNVIFLRKKDGELENTPEFREELVREIRKIKPDIIFSFDPSNHKFDNFYKYHPDHRAVGHAVFDCIYPAVGSYLFFPGLTKEGFKPHQIKEVYFFATENPNTLIDITSVIELKIKALKCHESQINHRDIDKFIRERCKETGKGKYEYAEAFRRLEVPS